MSPPVDSDGAVKVKGTITAIVDTALLATQATLAAVLARLPAAFGAGGGLKVDGSGTALPISAASLPLPTGAATVASLAAPGRHNPITPSDSTDITALASMGLECTVDGTVVYSAVNTPSTQITRTVVNGQYIWIQAAKVFAATTATMVGLAP